MNYKNQKLVLAATALVLIGFASCGKYDDGPKFSLKSKKARLTKNEWDVKEIDGEKLDGDMTLEFSKDGDFTCSYSMTFYGQTYKGSEKGDWEWMDGKEGVEITVDKESQEFTINRLTSKELWFDDEDNDDLVFLIYIRV